MGNHNHQKKIALINDMSGFGRCSITVQLPVISMLKVQCCPIPTAIFSNHTGYPEYFREDFTDSMEPYMKMWEKLKLQFQGICTGYLGSKQQISIVEHFIKDFKKEDTVVIVDPVMGDNGKLYSTYSEEMCQRMKKLVQSADIITPNLTEACVLTESVYREQWEQKEIEEMAVSLSLLGPEKIVITGILQNDFVSNLCYQKDKGFAWVKTHKAGTSRSGTGDIFAGVIAAEAVNGSAFQDSVKKASEFIRKCILKSVELDIPLTDGVCFEELLGTLK